MSKFATIVAALLLTVSATAYAADNNGGSNNGQNGGSQNNGNNGGANNNGDNGGAQNNGDNGGTNENGTDQNTNTNAGKTTNDGADKCKDKTGAAAADPTCKNVQQ